MRFIIPFFCLLLAACSKPQSKYEYGGIGYSQGLFLSESASDYQNITKRLHKWLLARGLTVVPSPGGMAELVGLHSKEDEDTWYKLPVGKHNILLRITLQSRFPQIQASTDYGNVTGADLNEIHPANLKLWLDIIAWMRAQKETNLLVVHNPLWFDNAEKGVLKAYSPNRP
jgi:hypothetical protein